MSVTYVNDGDLATPANVNEWLNRASGEIFNVKSYGAAGDGATDDTAALKAAYDAAVASGGGRILFPKDNSYLLETITEFDAGLQQGVLEISANNITIELEAGAKVVGSKSVGADASGYAIFVVKGANDFTLKGGVFDGSDARTVKGIGTVVALRPTLSNRIRIEGVTGLNLRYNAINSQSVTSANAPILNDITITGCHFNDCQGHGIVVEGANNVHIAHNHIENCYTTDFTAYGLNLSDGCNRMTAIGNTILNCDYGIKTESNASNDLESFDVSVLGNLVVAGANTSGYGIRISAERCLVQGNSFKGAFSWGFRIDSTALETCLIDGNIIDGATNAGLLNELGSIAETFVERNRTTIRGNVFANCSTTGLTIRSAGVLIEGNHFYEIENYFVRIRNDQNTNGTETYDNISVVNNKVLNCNGLRVERKTGQSMTGLVVVGNQMVLNIAADPTIFNANDVVYVGNLIKHITAGGKAQVFDTCENVTIHGNRAETVDEACIQVSNSDLYVISGNVVGPGLYGIRTTSTTTEGLVTGNADNGATNAYALDTNARAVANLGYVTEANGTATVTNGSTSIAVTHALDATPALADISVTPTNNLGNATKFWITSPTSTQFTINVDADPGATTATFAWTASIQ